jgi:hypothetical protein
MQGRVSNPPWRKQTRTARLGIRERLLRKQGGFETRPYKRPTCALPHERGSSPGG